MSRQPWSFDSRSDRSFLSSSRISAALSSNDGTDFFFNRFSRRARNGVIKNETKFCPSATSTETSLGPAVNATYRAMNTKTRRLRPCSSIDRLATTRVGERPTAMKTSAPTQVWDHFSSAIRPFQQIGSRLEHSGQIGLITGKEMTHESST